MKKQITITLIMISVLSWGQTKKRENTFSTVTNEPVNFARIIRYSVMVKDTSTLKTNLKQNDSLTSIDRINYYNADQYIDPISFTQFINVVMKYLHDPKAMAVIYGKIVSTPELKRNVFKCDTIDLTSFDKDGIEFVQKMYACDSVYLYYDIKRIEFVESWTIDSNTYEMKKEVLSYRLMEYDYDKLFWRGRLTIYKDEKALLKINSLIGPY